MSIKHDDGSTCMADFWKQSAGLLMARAERAEAMVADLWALIPPQEPSPEFRAKVEALLPTGTSRGARIKAEARLPSGGEPTRCVPVSKDPQTQFQVGGLVVLRNLEAAPTKPPACTCGYAATPTQHRLFCPARPRAEPEVG